MHLMALAYTPVQFIGLCVSAHTYIVETSPQRKMFDGVVLTLQAPCAWLLTKARLFEALWPFLLVELLRKEAFWLPTCASFLFVLHVSLLRRWPSAVLRCVVALAQLCASVLSVTSAATAAIDSPDMHAFAATLAAGMPVDLPRSVDYAAQIEQRWHVWGVLVLCVLGLQVCSQVASVQLPRQLLSKLLLEISLAQWVRARRGEWHMLPHFVGAWLLLAVPLYVPRDVASAKRFCLETARNLLVHPLAAALPPARHEHLHMPGWHERWRGHDGCLLLFMHQQCAADSKVTRVFLLLYSVVNSLVLVHECYTQLPEQQVFALEPRAQPAQPAQPALPAQPAQPLWMQHDKLALQVQALVLQQQVALRHNRDESIASLISFVVCWCNLLHGLRVLVALGMLAHRELTV